MRTMEYLKTRSNKRHKKGGYLHSIKFLSGKLLIQIFDDVIANNKPTMTDNLTLALQFPVRTERTLSKLTSRQKEKTDYCPVDLNHSFHLLVDNLFTDILLHLGLYRLYRLPLLKPEGELVELWLAKINQNFFGLISS